MDRSHNLPPFALTDSADIVTVIDAFIEGARIDERIAQIEAAIARDDAAPRGLSFSAQERNTFDRSRQDRILVATLRQESARQVIHSAEAHRWMLQQGRELDERHEQQHGGIMDRAVHAARSARSALLQRSQRREQQHQADPARRGEDINNILVEFAGDMASDEVCRICLGTFVDDECTDPCTITHTRCTCGRKQIFGRPCITAWLTGESTCPTCRNVLLAPLGASRTQMMERALRSIDPEGVSGRHAGSVTSAHQGLFQARPRLSTNARDVPIDNPLLRRLARPEATMVDREAHMARGHPQITSDGYLVHVNAAGYATVLRASSPDPNPARSTTSPAENLVSSIAPAVPSTMPMEPSITSLDSIQRSITPHGSRPSLPRHTYQPRPSGSHAQYLVRPGRQPPNWDRAYRPGSRSANVDPAEDTFDRPELTLEPRDASMELDNSRSVESTREFGTNGRNPLFQIRTRSLSGSTYSQAEQREPTVIRIRNRTDRRRRISARDPMSRDPSTPGMTVIIDGDSSETDNEDAASEGLPARRRTFPHGQPSDTPSSTILPSIIESPGIHPVPRHPPRPQVSLQTQLATLRIRRAALHAQLGIPPIRETGGSSGNIFTAGNLDGFRGGFRIGSGRVHDLSSFLTDLQHSLAAEPGRPARAQFLSEYADPFVSSSDDSDSLPSMLYSSPYHDLEEEVDPLIRHLSGAAALGQWRVSRSHRSLRLERDEAAYRWDQHLSGREEFLRGLRSGAREQNNMGHRTPLERSAAVMGPAILESHGLPIHPTVPEGVHNPFRVARDLERDEATYWGNQNLSGREEFLRGLRSGAREQNNTGHRTPLERSAAVMGPAILESHGLPIHPTVPEGVHNPLRVARDLEDWSPTILESHGRPIHPTVPEGVHNPFRVARDLERDEATYMEEFRRSLAALMSPTILESHEHPSSRPTDGHAADLIRQSYGTEQRIPASPSPPPPSLASSSHSTGGTILDSQEAAGGGGDQADDDELIDLDAHNLEFNEWYGRQ